MKIDCRGNDQDGMELTEKSCFKQYREFLADCNHSQALKTDAQVVSEFRIKEHAKKAVDEITSDLSGVITEEGLTIDGEKVVWKMIMLTENEKLIKYCFRMLDGGT